MKKASVLIGLFLLFLFACTHEKKASFLSTHNIRTQLFQIDPTKETRINGARGAIFTIPAGAFEGTETVTIELKEVYAPIEILAAGLRTESNGELLESGGMFYLNAKRDGEEVELKKEISGSIPADYINDSMKLFKGEVEDDGNLNWVDPVSLTTDTTMPELDCRETGRRLFWSNCASCHSVNQRLTGPSLAGADKKVTRELYYKFVRNPVETARNSKYYRDLIAEYSGVLMTAFPLLNDKDIDCIIDYVNSPVTDSLLTSLPDTLQNSTSEFPCGFDTTFIDTGFTKIVQNAFAGREEQLESIVDKEIILTDTIIPNNIPRYTFDINTFGWYNIDILVEEMEGIDEVNLSATTDFPDKESISVMLYFPEKRISASGYYNAQLNAFVFGQEGNKMDLFIGDLALLFSIAEKDNQLFYDVHEFRIEASQTIKISLQETTQEKLQAAFEEINLDNINLDRLTKKAVVVPIPCGGTDTIPNK